ncbi:MAG: MBL fold metallo-hydrolase [Dehalococcoidia bacterium]|jgi:glyoxylase-like metal-dependent hydrolase (beta-lactamase superfamily II)
MEEILPNLYRIEVPLPGSPLKATNSYVVKGTERSLIIDTGWNREDCMAALVSGLKECGVALGKSDLFITHMHADHSGLVSAIAVQGTKIYFGRADAEIIRYTKPEHWDRMIDFASICGFPREELKRAIGNHPGRRYSPGSSLNLSILKDGDTVSIGDYLFECIETPGHTPGHICLYEHDKKVLICGDHILFDITPNITLSTEERNPLKEYLMSLDKVYDLDVRLALPGHRSTFSNQKERIQELKRHHQARLEEVSSILAQGKQNAFQIASQMIWDIGYKSWDLFPPAQKLFAFGEALAHLKYLEEEGAVDRAIEGNGILFLTRVSNA